MSDIRSNRSDLPSPTPGLPRPFRRLVKRGAILFGVLAVAAIAAHRPILVNYARLFRVNNPAPSDALVVLAGSSGRNARTAAVLYRRGIATTVLLMRKPLVPFSDLNRSEVDRLILIRHGVPSRAIQLLPPVRASESVHEEAGRMAEYVRRHPLHKVTLVAASSQTARARRAFRKALARAGVEIRAAAVPDPGFDETVWYRKDEGLVDYFRETFLTLYYYFVY